MRRIIPVVQFALKLLFVISIGYAVGVSGLFQFLIYLAATLIIFSHVARAFTFSVVLLQKLLIDRIKPHDQLNIVADVIYSPDGPNADLHYKWSELSIDFLSMCRAFGISRGQYILESTHFLRGINARAFGISGIGPSIVQISDDSVRKLNDSQLRVVCAHELSHIVLDHSLKSLKLRTLTSIVFILILMGMVSMGSSFLAPVELGKLVIGGILALQLISILLINYFARRFEYEADRASIKLVSIEEIESLFHVLEKEARLKTTKLSRFLILAFKPFNTHPSLKARISALKE